MTDTAEGKPVYRALDMLLTECIPTFDDRAPFWRPKPPVAADGTGLHRHVYTPDWSWESATLAGIREVMVDLDVNGAFLAAASSAQFAHGQLIHTEAVPASTAAKVPGYYLISHHLWPHPGIVSPLGTMAPGSERLWVTAPTVQLLDQLAADGFWPRVDVWDSWTADGGRACRLRRWTERVKADRAEVLKLINAHPDDADARDRYDAIKDGYSIAAQMMYSGKKTLIHRPDWYHTIHAQHAANTWRKAWSALQAGYWPVAMDSCDEITFLMSHYEMMCAAPKPPFRLDQTGISLGSLKLKTIRTPGEEGEPE